MVFQPETVTTTEELTAGFFHLPVTTLKPYVKETLELLVVALAMTGVRLWLAQGKVTLMVRTRQKVRIRALNILRLRVDWIFL